MRDSRRTRFVLAVLLLVSITLITLDLRGGSSSPLNRPRSLVASLFAPVESAAAAIVRPVRNAITAIGDIGRSQHRINQLENANAALEQQLRTEPYNAARVKELNALLRVAAAGQYRTVPAQVIAVGPGQGFAWTATIDAGSRDGVHADQTVLDGDGLVGRVVSVTSSTATVLLANDPTSTVGARVEGSQELALLTGAGTNPMQLELLDPQRQVAAGDRIVTFGSQGDAPYVPGVPIGYVLAVHGQPGSLTKVATVQPYVSFTALDLVGVVVQPPRTDPRDSVLPSKPKPAPTVTVTVTATPGAPSSSSSPPASGGRPSSTPTATG